MLKYATTVDTELLIWKQEAPCDICITVRVLTSDLVVCVHAEQTAGFDTRLRLLVPLPVSLLSHFTTPCLMVLKYYFVSDKLAGVD